MVRSLTPILLAIIFCSSFSLVNKILARYCLSAIVTFSAMRTNFNYGRADKNCKNYDGAECVCAWVKRCTMADFPFCGACTPLQFYCLLKAITKQNGRQVQKIRQGVFANQQQCKLLWLQAINIRLRSEERRVG